MEINIREQSYCVVAVGSTQFQDLIQSLDNADFYNLLKLANITGVLFQIGSGQYQPTNYPKDNSLTVKVHDYIVLEDYIKHADLIITHCGAGTLLESLRAEGSPEIMAVINTSLMDNHQAELADQLEADGHIYKAEPATVLSKLTQLIESKGNRNRGTQVLTKYPPRAEGIIVEMIDSLLLQ